MTTKEAITAVKEVTGMSLPWDDRHYEALQLAIEALHQFANPGKKVSAEGQDLISRQALCEYALNQIDKSVTPNDIMRFPSAQPDISEYSDKLWRSAYERGKRDARPEIISCNQCVHYQKKNHYCEFLDILDMEFSPSDYCSYAERRNDG